MLGKKAQDIWGFKDPMYPTYPTQKNQDMLQFIIKASSLPDSIVMDCFCGSGSTLLAADYCSRKWIGIDKSEVSIEVIKQNLRSSSSLFPIEYSFLSLI